MLTAALIEDVLPVFQTALLSTYTYHPVMAYPDDAEAAMVDGEETVEPVAGDETLTVTLADATMLQSVTKTNVEKKRKGFPSWSSMGTKGIGLSHDYHSTLSLMSR
jgi:hypothetical protein